MLLKPRDKILHPNWSKLFIDYIAQNNYCIIEFFNCSFLKNNIEAKDGCKFDKIVREIICDNFNRFVNTCIKY